MGMISDKPLVRAIRILDRYQLAAMMGRLAIAGVARNWHKLVTAMSRFWG